MNNRPRIIFKTSSTSSILKKLVDNNYKTPDFSQQSTIDGKKDIPNELTLPWQDLRDPAALRYWLDAQTNYEQIEHNTLRHT